MAKLTETFNSADVPEREDFTPVPPGVYTGMIVASEIKATEAGGEMIVLEIDIQEGEHAGRKLFERLNIKNDNVKAVDIAFRTLGEIVKAVGKTTIKDTEELHNKRISMEVRVEPGKQKKKNGKLVFEEDGTTPVMYGPSNAIKKFLPVSGSVSTPKAGSTTSATVESDSGKAVPPWRKKTSA